MAQLTQEQYNTLKQRGLSDQKIAQLAQERGFDLPGGNTGLKGFATGLVKGFVGDVAVSTARTFQEAGQRVIAAATPLSLDEVRENTGFKSLDVRTPEGRGVEETLKGKTTAERAGKTAANIAAFFMPASKATQVSGRVAQGAGRTVAKLGIGISAKEAPLIQAYRARTPLRQRIDLALRGTEKAGKPVTNRETALRQNIFGTEGMIGVKARRGSNRIWKGVVEPALDASKTKIQMSSFIDEVGSEIDEIDDLSRRKELHSALEALREDFAEVGEISLKKLQRYKEGWAKFLPDKVYKGKPIAGAFREVQNMAAHLARNKIYSELGDEVRAAYFDYSNLKNLQELGQKALTQSKLKGGAGTFISGVKDMALTPVASSGGLALYRAGKGLEFVGTVGLKTVKQVFGF